MRTIRDVHVFMSFQQDLFILLCHAYPPACGAADGRRVRAGVPENTNGDQQPMQSPFPRKQAGMPGKRLIDSIPIPRASFGTLQTSAGFIDYG